MAAPISFPASRSTALGLLYSTLGTLTGLTETRADGESVRRARQLINSAVPFVGGVSSALNRLFSALDRLRASAGVLLSSNENGVFNQKEGFSSQENLVGVFVRQGAQNQETRVAVLQKAQTQQNIGDALDGATTTDIYEGANYVTITGGDRTATVSFEVSRIDGNRSALLELANQINFALAGVTAEVQNDGNSFRLVLTSTGSGAGGGFTISDSAGNAVSVTAADTVVLAAQDASYALDGEMASSATNQVELQNGAVQLELNGTTTGLVKVQVRSNPADVVGAVKDFAIDFNDLLALLSNGNLAQSARAREALGRQIRGLRRDLASVGITQDASGRLQVNEAALRAALADRPDDVEAVLGGPAGLATSIAGGLGRIATSPLARKRLGVVPSPTGLSATLATAGFAVDLRV